MIPMLDKQNNLADVLPVQMEPRKEWSVNICLCYLHVHGDLIGSLNTGPTRPDLCYVYELL